MILDHIKSCNIDKPSSEPNVVHVKISNYTASIICNSLIKQQQIHVTSYLAAALDGQQGV